MEQSGKWLLVLLDLIRSLKGRIRRFLTSFILKQQAAADELRIGFGHSHGGATDVLGANGNGIGNARIMQDMQSDHIYRRAVSPTFLYSLAWSQNKFDFFKQ